MLALAPGFVDTWLMLPRRASLSRFLQGYCAWCPYLNKWFVKLLCPPPSLGYKPCWAPLHKPPQNCCGSKEP